MKVLKPNWQHQLIDSLEQYVQNVDQNKNFIARSKRATFKNAVR